MSEAPLKISHVHFYDRYDKEYRGCLNEIKKIGLKRTGIRLKTVVAVYNKRD
jgi:hypothetical protein